MAIGSKLAYGSAARAALAAILLVCTVCSAPAATAFTVSSGEPIAQGAKVVVVMPDVDLGQVTASNVRERRPDWIANVRTGLSSEVGAALEAKNHPLVTLDRDTLESGPVDAFLGLYDYVTATMQAMDTDDANRIVQWSVGPSGAPLAERYGADYALFISVSGSYSSSGRLLAVYTVAPLTFMRAPKAVASLVDLRSGRIIWFASEIAPNGIDLRQPAGAAKMARLLMAGAPL